MNKSTVQETEMATLSSESEHHSAPSEFESNASAGIRAEKALSVKDALRKWPKAILWSFVFGTSIIMEGYDQALLGTLWGYPEFQKQYGRPVKNRDKNHVGQIVYQVSAPWQSGIQCGICIMSMLGVLLGGHLAHRFGYRPTFIIALLSILALVFGTVFSNNMPTLLVAELLIGIPYGIFSSLGPAYASEIAPLVLRGYLATYINACWLIGQLLAAGVTKGLISRKDQWAYKIPFAIQWAWPLPIMLAVFLAPESPWHLVRAGERDAARRALSKCCREDLGVNLDYHLAMMVQTNELEIANEGGTSYMDCFRGIDLRRTEISCITWAVQQFCGSPFASQATYFFTVAGISRTLSYSLGTGTYALGLLATSLSWILMSYCGRRTIYFSSTIMMSILMLGIGTAAVLARSNQIALYAQAGLMLTFYFIYNMTVGPLAYSLVAEMSSTRLRAKTVGVARCFYNFVGMIAFLVQPYLINPTALNLQGRVGFIWAGLGAVSAVWIYFRLPEPQHRTYEELDIMFLKRLPARKFQSYAQGSPKELTDNQV